MNEQDAAAYMAEVNRKHAEWLAKPLDRSGWLDLLMRCQDGRATCLYVLEKIEADIDSAVDGACDINSRRTPNVNLPPLSAGPKRAMEVTINVSADFQNRLDNQWEVEREIHADRWTWRWAPTVSA